MTDSAQRPVIDQSPAPITTHRPVQRSERAAWLSSLLRTTDHKMIARLYLVTTFAFFIIAGVMAMGMRAELARPGMQLLSHEQYNQLFTACNAVAVRDPAAVRIREVRAALADRRARHNFTRLPRIHSERPAFDYHYPHLHPRLEQEKYLHRGSEEDAETG